MVIVVINDYEDDSDNDQSKNNNRSQYLLHVYFVLGTMKSASYTLSHLNLKKKKKQKTNTPAKC